MTWLYNAIKDVLTAIGAYFLGRSKQQSEDKANAAEEALKRAKIAKDTRSGAKLSDEWLRPRD